MDDMINALATISRTGTENSVRAIRACNDLTARFGLVLTEEDIGELMQSRTEALKASGRIEFGEGILPKLIYAFCDSPYIEPDDYADTLAKLQDAFYYYKSESGDAYSDDELIEFMTAVFNGPAQGSTDYLIETSLESLVRHGAV